MTLPSQSSLRAKPALGDFAGTLLLVGAGKMGSALLEGWLALGLPADKIVVVDPQPTDSVVALEKRGLRLNPDLSRAPATAFMIAVKPQVAPQILPALVPAVDAKTVVVSIMAGRGLDFLGRGLPANTAIVRAMPNTPASVGRGITVAVGNAKVSEAQRALADRLLAATGVVEWISDETLMDAVTAVSGSGPAYVFLLAESLMRAGIAAGLPPDLAERLGRATVAGAGELLHRSTLPAAALRQNVTSPGGTTAAALAVLMAENGLDPLMERAVAAATKRSRELAG